MRSDSISPSPLQSPDRRGAELADFAEAVVNLAACRVAVRLLPFAWAMRCMGHGVIMEVNAESGPVIDRSIRAIERAERRIFWKSRCIDRGMALHRMLRRRGVASQLVYGLANNPENLAAHVWVVVGRSTVMGGAEAADFREVARFPPAQDTVSSS